jgi:hypothetical protein
MQIEVSSTLWPINSERTVPLDRSLTAPQGQSGYSDGKDEPPRLCRESNPCRPSLGLVAVPTELSHSSTGPAQNNTELPQQTIEIRARAPSVMKHEDRQASPLSVTFMNEFPILTTRYNVFKWLLRFVPINRVIGLSSRKIRKFVYHIKMEVVAE